MRRIIPLGALCLAALTSTTALAVQPLEEFVKGAREHNVDLAEQQASLAQSQAQADVALGRALPGVAVRGTYTRNQYDATVKFPVAPGAPPQTITITPFNQLDAIGTLNVPIVDLASFRRISSANTAADATGKLSENAQLQVESQVVQGYYQLLAYLALVTASQKSVDVAKASLELAQANFQSGKVPALDVDRATAEMERQVQALASAQLQATLAARALQTLSGVTPEVTGEVALADDLHGEAGLESFDPGSDGPPIYAAAKLLSLSADQGAQASRLQLVPSLSGSFTERITNAAGFVGHEASYQAVLALNWQLDYGTFANMRLQDAVAAGAHAREERARLQTRDAIHRAWSTVVTNIARARSARAQEAATQRAAELAKDRYAAGAATQLDLLAAQRDAFSAEAGRIQADAELINARAQLQLSAGRDPFASKSAASGAK